MKVAMAKQYTKDDAIKAFVDSWDGNFDWEDIRRHTGLPDERCKEISAIWGAAAAGKLVDRAAPIDRPFLNS